MTTLRVVVLSAVLSVLAIPARPTAQAPQPAGPPFGSAAALAAQGQQPRYTGTPIDIDFQGADLRMVLRQLADIGGVNLVIDPSVPPGARVDVKLTQVPWDQALEVVLKQGQLTREIDGSVVRVVTLKALQGEQDDLKKLSDQRNEKLARESVKPRVFQLNYAKGTDLEKVLKVSALSSYGNTQFDERTNTLVVIDIPDRLDQVAALIAQLDRPEPQVEIEARIVQINRDSARALGMQWGVNGRMLPELGNTTNLAFPNSGQLSGKIVDNGKPATMQANDPRAIETQRTGTAVNLPAVGATSAIGLSMAAINGAFNLDVALSALEHQGKAKILSTPRVTTSNNKEAQMAQGFEIPFQTVSNNTVSVTFRDAALKLTVTPHITGANTVIMDVQLENGVPDFGRAVNGNPSINTQRATTKVQVPDGITTVIGGILSSSESSSSSGTPGLSRIPLLGWLFKNNSNSSESHELVIFITPRIIR